MASFKKILAWAGLATGTAQDPEAIARGLLQTGMGQVVEVEAVPSTNSAGVKDAQALPTVMMHGMGDFGDNPMGMRKIKEGISQKTGSWTHSVELCSEKDKLDNCNGEDQMNGFFMNMDDQVDQFARVVRADAKLAGGFNAIGFSQGNSVIRGYIHRYNQPPVRSFVSMHGTLMGVASIPRCPLSIPGVGALCKGMDKLVSLGAYTSFVQNRLAQANYFRDPTRLSSYRQEGHFLPYINNEVKGKENSTYTANFQALNHLVLVMAESDTMVHPKESEHFGFFKDGSMTELIAMQDAPWYTEDWFGLKSLDQQNKVDLYSTKGDHLQFNMTFLYDMVEKYFVSSSSPSAAATTIQI
mmetsp:Transcript_35200/g.74942  ORF Transcript_35200/g.74942 Transcript_35200/m.74942 type:complete len:355 (+) Transcript_35200:56-1120(+)|eukprot:CAMPEP_0206500592 /NCGR_PEP_ID=MMETSP0324_2-20121206/52647_1 /ASSEMBLY_ACC=CAM_ASM_000836 /TAXON_ID=2866 /ORGANISM="Crypthecodinium cohnii, Strain Seligo" /LENGTH=354 /DNA_ID=CAMNT_0053987931 /DNA_START=32 /DNA_END=1096 /DNA_ORIENTATION=-